jgi:hypothetical protein
MKHIVMLRHMLTYIFFQLKIHMGLKMLMGLALIFLFYMLCYVPQSVDFLNLTINTSSTRIDYL